MRRGGTVSIDVSANASTQALSLVDHIGNQSGAGTETELRQTASRVPRGGKRRWSSTIFPTPARARRGHGD